VIKSLSILGFLAILAVQPLFALTQVPKDYPEQDEQSGSGEIAPTNDQLARLVAIYQNNVALLATDPEQHEIKVQEVEVDQAVVEEVRRLAGDPLTLEGLVRAVAQILRETPERAVPVTAAALFLAGPNGLDLPGQSQVAIVARAIQTINGRGPNHTEDIAILIGFAVQRVPAEERNDVLRQLRSLAIFQMPDGQRVEYAFALDTALEQYQVVFQNQPSDEFMRAAMMFLPEAQMDAFTDFGDFLAVDFASSAFYSGDAILVPPFGSGGLFFGNNPGLVLDPTLPLQEEPVTPPQPTPTPQPPPPAS
jgi:hypothetical protein